MVKEKDRKIGLELDMKQFEKLKYCFRIVQDLLSITETINESALNLLVDIDIEERDEIERFVEGF